MDLDGVELAALSHGHYDHADGLRAFFALNDRAPVYIRPQAGEAYYSKSGGSPRFVGIHWEILGGLPGPLRAGGWAVPPLPRGLAGAGDRPGRALCQPGALNLLRKVGEDRLLPDDFSHEQSMVLETGRGLVVLTPAAMGVW